MSLNLALQKNIGNIEDIIQNSYSALHGNKMANVKIEILPENKFQSINEKRSGQKLESEVAGLYYPSAKKNGGLISIPQYKNILLQLLIISHEIGHNETLKNDYMRQTGNFTLDVLNEAAAYSYQNVVAQYLANVVMPEYKNEILWWNELINNSVADKTKPHYHALQMVKEFDKNKPGYVFETLSNSKLNKF